MPRSRHLRSRRINSKSSLQRSRRSRTRNVRKWWLAVRYTRIWASNARRKAISSRCCGLRSDSSRTNCSKFSSID